ncbi:hypothetical protein B5C34_13335 [Pacificimonas flava]|uniref:Uncharacterized protein n=1 Tax=Pacificimonas flava TaxID=1234595 RepID=A0A219B834_9SPHN|nr:hypothetical protein B5C34_13335 [Pacificimonas flava]
MTQTAPELPPVDPEMASRVIFSPDGETSVGRGAYNLFGSAAGNEELVIGVGAQVTLDPSFNEGGDTIVLPGDFADFTATRNGSTLVLEDGLGTILRLPLGTEPTILGFDDGDYRVFFDTEAGEVVFEEAGGSIVPASAFADGGMVAGADMAAEAPLAEHVDLPVQEILIV